MNTISILKPVLPGLKLEVWNVDLTSPVERTVDELLTVLADTLRRGGFVQVGPMESQINEYAEPYQPAGTITRRFTGWGYRTPPDTEGHSSS